jgi:hypothetical protein
LHEEIFIFVVLIFLLACMIVFFKNISILWNIEYSEDKKKLLFDKDNEDNEDFIPNIRYVIVCLVVLLPSIVIYIFYMFYQRFFPTKEIDPLKYIRFDLNETLNKILQNYKEAAGNLNLNSTQRVLTTTRLNNISYKKFLCQMIKNFKEEPNTQKILKSIITNIVSESGDQIDFERQMEINCPKRPIEDELTVPVITPDLLPRKKSPPRPPLPVGK